MYRGGSKVGLAFWHYAAFRTKYIIIRIWTNKRIWT